MPPPAPGRPYLPIAVGFYLLGLPLFAVAAFAASATEAWTNAAVGAVLVGLGAVLHRRPS